MGIEELRAELLAARAELSRVKKSGMSAATTAAPGQLQTQTPEVNELHTKLQRLRQEQAEADAARDKAWKQLKVGWTLLFCLVHSKLLLRSGCCQSTYRVRACFCTGPWNVTKAST